MFLTLLPSFSCLSYTEFLIFPKVEPHFLNRIFLKCGRPLQLYIIEGPGFDVNKRCLPATTALSRELLRVLRL